MPDIIYLVKRLKKEFHQLMAQANSEIKDIMKVI